MKLFFALKQNKFENKYISEWSRERNDGKTGFPVKKTE